MNFVEVNVRKVWFLLVVVTGLVAAACSGPTDPDGPMMPDPMMESARNR